ncbi:MAG: RNA polymerase sigma factor, partial [Lachnospiraceae bacterium]
AICTALEKCDSIRNPDALRTWIYRVVVNEALQLLRKGKREVSWDPQIMPEDVYWEAPVEEVQEVYAQVQKLPPPIKTIILLRFYEELSLKEIAQVTGLNINTVKSRLYRGLADLGKTISA